MPSSPAAPPLNPLAAPPDEAEDRGAAAASSLAAERAAREQAELAAQARDHFLAITAHDLRSPLNGIQSWANVLQMQIPADAPAPMVRALAGIRNGVEQQARLIEELLDKARVLDGSVELNIAEISPAPAIQAAIAHAGDAASARGVQLVFVTIDAPERIRADASRLEQMTRLLLTDALASAPRDSEIRVTLAGTRDALKLRVTCQANTPGIASDGAPAQERTTSGDPESRRADIGWLLIRRLAELQGGSLSMNVVKDAEDPAREVTLPL